MTNFFCQLVRIVTIFNRVTIHHYIPNSYRLLFCAEAPNLLRVHSKSGERSCYLSLWPLMLEEPPWGLEICSIHLKNFRKCNLIIDFLNFFNWIIFVILPIFLLWMVIIMITFLIIMIISILLVRISYSLRINKVSLHLSNTVCFLELQHITATFSPYLHNQGFHLSDGPEAWEDASLAHSLAEM